MAIVTRAAISLDADAPATETQQTNTHAAAACYLLQLLLYTAP